MRSPSQNVTSMSLLGLLAFALGAFFQAAAAPSSIDDLLDSKEKASMASAANIGDRIKVYQTASRRYQKSLESAISDNDSSQIPDDLKRWTALLSASLEDIETNLTTKKKSKVLIRYEIELRKDISTFHSYKTRVPADLQDQFGSSLDKAEKIRKRFIEMIFQH
jgi:hypothetical protein